MLDSAVKLLGGDASINDVMDMEIEEFRDLVEIRAEQRKKSLERFNKTGEKDLYIDQGDSNEMMMQLMLSMMGHSVDIKGNKAVKPGIEPNKDPREYMRQKEFLQDFKKNFNK